jgi:hypothetical protein
MMPLPLLLTRQLLLISALPADVSYFRHAARCLSRRHAATFRCQRDFDIAAMPLPSDADAMPPDCLQLMPRAAMKPYRRFSPTPPPAPPFTMPLRQPAGQLRHFRRHFRWPMRRIIFDSRHVERDYDYADFAGLPLLLSPASCWHAAAASLMPPPSQLSLRRCCCHHFRRCHFTTPLFADFRCLMALYYFSSRFAAI